MKTIRELMDLKGKKILLTGGCGHIGRAACEAFIELGGEVAILDSQAESVSKENLHFFRCDLRDENETRVAAKHAISKLDGLDVLVHSAAYVGTTKMEGWNAPFAKQTVGAWDEALRVNLTAAFVLSQESYPFLSESKDGSIILISSIYGMVGPNMGLYEGTTMENPAAYNASKGGLLQLMRYLATRFAPKVRVNAISPGGVWRDQPEKFVRRYQEKTPMARMATEEDLKGALVFLASGLSQYVTGHNLVVDGGYTIW